MGCWFPTKPLTAASTSRQATAPAHSPPPIAHHQPATKASELTSTVAGHASNAASTATETAAQLDQKVTGGKVSATSAAAAAAASTAAAIDERYEVTDKASAAAKTVVTDAASSQVCTKKLCHF